MNTKGFTLVELLAVIIILALLVLITGTSVTKLVKDSKQDLSDTQIELIKSAAEMWGADNLGKLPNSGECKFITLKVLKEYGLLDSSIVDANTNEEISDDLKIKITGTTGTYGNLVISYEVNPDSVDTCSEITKTYADGEVVYFNVTTGKSCTDYTEAQSSTGVKTGCMKFYAFNDDGSETVNLLLDHNTTAYVAWNSSGRNATGPSELLTQLASDTSAWVGTETPTNYAIDQSAVSSGAKYTVDYSAYKARLISAEEIAQITGNTSWDVTSESSIWYYFDSLITTASITCTSGDTSGCTYGWLYDRTSKDCTDYGCLNNSDTVTYGYWTISSHASNSSNAWRVNYLGYLYYSLVGEDSSLGVRPVIEVLKSNL